MDTFLRDYRNVKNPFGLRNGRIMTINDLEESERGLACNCVCPNCMDPFEAKMGPRRIPHFAHSGKGCDQTTAYLMGLYEFFKSFLLSVEFCVPRLTVFFHIDNRFYKPINEDTVYDQIRFDPGYETYEKITLSNDISIRFDNAEIIKRKSRPEAVVASYHGKCLAFVIAPPDTVCKNYSAQPYKDLATLEIILSKKDEIISRANTEMMNKIFSDSQNYKWLSNPLVLTAIDKINERQKEAHDLYLAKLEQKRREQEERLRKEEDARRIQFEERRKKLEEERKAHALAEERRRQNEERKREIDRQRIEEQIKIPGQIVFDSQGRRLIQCEICGKITTEDAFWTYQGNCGKCKDCENKVTVSKINTVPLPVTNNKAAHPDTCPWCGGKLVKKNGRYGEFIGCSNYPKCWYSR